MVSPPFAPCDAGERWKVKAVWRSWRKDKALTLQSPEAVACVHEPTIGGNARWR